MSSLIFYTDPEQALVVTDTLATNPDGSPFLFTSKAHYLPHLRTVVAGTGIGGFAAEWAMIANNRMVARGIQNMDFHAPKGLRELWSKYKKEYCLPAEVTSTVYHFGFSEETGELVSFAYRSTNEFESERLQHGVAVKPECTVPTGNLIEHLEAMMVEQRQIQAGKPINERIHIGGEAHAIHLTKSACTFSCLFHFPDFADQQAHVFRS